ncbi:c-type cytochrome [Roseomonas sp. JC162]|uniref:C-type cytochrome n=1 Tax=Neoroseomonas marina TaxID=1232220 RepID=A0A848E8S1_9PROT|nr:c-type cytochrome [Neoroseomonas marina]NMJ40841.1 c-type cytochrome [Neoroseomonas marina]
MRRLLAAAVLAAAFAQPGMAQDAARGAPIAADRCAACHGADGRSQMPDIPSLAGQQAGFVTLQMILIREGIRHVPAMADVTRGMPDQDIEDLAAYFASLPPAPPEDRRPRDATLAAAGEALIGPRRCGVCHLPALTGRDQIPRIVAQHETYLARAMMEYRDGHRVGADTQMNGAMVGLSDADIAALAHYLAHRD